MARRETGRGSTREAITPEQHESARREAEKQIARRDRRQSARDLIASMREMRRQLEEVFPLPREKPDRYDEEGRQRIQLETMLELHEHRAMSIADQSDTVAACALEKEDLRDATMRILLERGATLNQVAALGTSDSPTSTEIAADPKLSARRQAAVRRNGHAKARTKAAEKLRRLTDELRQEREVSTEIEEQVTSAVLARLGLRLADLDFEQMAALAFLAYQTATRFLDAAGILGELGVPFDLDPETMRALGVTDLNDAGSQLAIQVLTAKRPEPEQN